MGIGRALARWLDGTVVWRAFFSLSLAIALWLWVTNLEDPETMRRFSGVVPKIVQRAPELVVLESDKLPAVTIDVHGPRTVLQNLTADDIQAEVDLSGVTQAGTHDAAVRVRAPRRVRVSAATPASIPITVDTLGTKTFPLDVEKQPSPASYNISRVDAAVQQVTVRGPSSLLERVTRVVLPVALGERRENFEAQFTPEARDSSGTRVQGLTLNPASVNASVTVSRTGRTVSVVANLTGTVPEGYRVANTTVSPAVVVVDGPQEVLNRLILVLTAPIDISGQTTPFSVYDVQLALPPDIRLVDASSVNVQVQIERPQVRQQFSGVRIAPVNLGNGLRATFTPAEVTIALSGPLERLRQLNGADIQVEVDLQGLGVGVHTVTPRVVVPPDLQVVEQPQPIRVQIELAATPAPARTPTPTRVPTVSPTTSPPTPTTSGALLRDWLPRQPRG